MASEIERQLGTVDDPALQALVAELGRRVAVAAGAPAGSLRFERSPFRVRRRLEAGRRVKVVVETPYPP